jgi:mannose-1-phosphate guanylyltransferase
VVNFTNQPVETNNSLIYSSKKKLMVRIGVDDSLIIDLGVAYVYVAAIRLNRCAGSDQA